MSWEFHLVTPGNDWTEVVTLASFNYTSNIGTMIERAFCNLGSSMTSFADMHGLEGPGGAWVFHALSIELTKQPEYYDMYAPANGWGCRATLAELCKAMRDAVPEGPRTRWLVRA